MTFKARREGESHGYFDPLEWLQENGVRSGKYASTGQERWWEFPVVARVSLNNLPARSFLLCNAGSLLTRLSMPRPFLLFVCACLTLGALLPSVAARAEQPPIRLLTKADPLPLLIDPAIQFRKMRTYFLEDPEVTGIPIGVNDEQSIAFERKRLTYGAVTASDIRDRYGNYFTFAWRTKRPANLAIRLEYRQQKLGAFVQAREVDYPNANGSYVTQFQINGDDYLQQGRVSQWRVLLIENHQYIVALSQSFLWR